MPMEEGGDGVWHIIQMKPSRYLKNLFPRFFLMCHRIILFYPFLSFDRDFDRDIGTLQYVKQEIINM